MPRPMKPDLIVKRKISLPATLCGTVEFLLADPKTPNRPKYGALSGLIERLLTEWVEQNGASKIKESL
jgi:hypothetical protein